MAVVFVPNHQQRSHCLSRRRAPLVIASAALGTFVIYTLVVTYIILSGMHEPGSFLSRTRRLGVSLAVNSNDMATTLPMSSDQGTSRQLLVATAEQKWAHLWNSKLYRGKKTWAGTRARVIVKGGTAALLHFAAPDQIVFVDAWLIRC